MFSDLEHSLLPLMDLAGHDFELHARQHSVFLSCLRMKYWPEVELSGNISFRKPSVLFSELLFLKTRLVWKGVFESTLHGLQMCWWKAKLFLLLSPNLTVLRLLPCDSLNIFHVKWGQISSRNLGFFLKSLSPKRLITMYIHNWQEQTFPPDSAKSEERQQKISAE